jgi:RNA polymerase sigma factor (sigma-70 family)
MRSLTGSRAGTVAPSLVAARLLSDARLARLASNGSEVAFAAIFERYHQALYRYCHSILGDGHDAADALQNTMLSALRALPGETRQIALRAWLYRIAHNESVSLLRTRRADSDLQSAAHVGDLVAEGVVESRERLRALTADLQQLTQQQRGALLLRELGELQFSEVACVLRISAAAAKQSVYEARCALQAMEQGRAMDCDAVRRALSNGDRRMLRAKGMRGHLRACAGCQDFQAALRQRPAHLAALVPPSPLAMTAAMLHGVLDGAGHGGGGGLLAGLGASVTTGSAFSLVPAKVATVALVAGSVTGGAVALDPGGRAARPTASALTRDGVARDGRSVAALRAAARDRHDVFSLRSSDGRRIRSTPETSVIPPATTADTTHGVPAQRRAGPSPSPTAADTAELSAAKTGHATAPDEAATGDPEPPPTQAPQTAAIAGRPARRTGRSAHPAGKPAHPAGKPAHPTGKPAHPGAPPAEPVHPGAPPAPPTEPAPPAAKPAHQAAKPAKPAHPTKPARPGTKPASTTPAGSAAPNAPGSDDRRVPGGG